MAIIRFILGKLILFWEKVAAPTPVARTEAEQRRVQGNLAGLEIYQFQACPFCVKVRRFLQAQGVGVPLRDAKQEPYRSELVQGGGKLQVPCLKITQPQGGVQWLYESDDIIAFLRTQIQL